MIRNTNLDDIELKNWNVKTQRSPKTNLKIAFIVTGIGQFSGGLTSILRMGTYLSKFGHQVYYISLGDTSSKSLKTNAKVNLDYFQGEIVTFEESKKMKFDVAIATIWRSCYFLWEMKNVEYKAYFIQDFEPSFYKTGDIQAFCANSYLMGFHMISEGIWNKKQIEEKFKVKADNIVFPFEPEEYWPIEDWKKKIQKKKTLSIAIYLKNDEKRGPVFLLLGLDELYSVAKEKGIEVILNFFGNPKDFQYPLNAPYINRGLLSKPELRQLYQESDFGVVFSYTNISFVSLEMIACGLSVVEVESGTFKDFYPEDCAILVKNYPQDFVKKILYYFDNPEERIKMIEKGMKLVIKDNWDTASKEFNRLIVEGYNTKF